MSEKILLVDDDENILRGYHRVLRNTFDLEVAQGGVQALQALENHGPFAVLVSDMRMPGMSGLELLRDAEIRFPDTIRIMLTGNLELQTAVDAVNHGHVFRFLTKPCSVEDLGLALQAGLRQHQLVRSEKELLEKTLMGSIQVMVELMASVDPVVFSRSQEVRLRAVQVARSLGIEPVWDLEISALLGPIGRITLPGEMLRPGQSRPEAASLLARIPEVSAGLLQPIPRLERVARIVRYQSKGFDGTGFPADEVMREELPIEARILKVLWDFAEHEAARKNRAVAMEELRRHAARYDPIVLEAWAALVGGDPRTTGVRKVEVAGLEPGIRLAEDVLTTSGRLVLAAGLRLGAGHLELLRSLHELLDLQEPIAVFGD